MDQNRLPAGPAGLHHITAIAGDPQQNVDFYTSVLGQRLIKRTVNFDDPGTWHFYYADAVGSAGTVLTFFPWAGVPKGVRGSGEATAVAYSVAADALPAWRIRLAAHDVAFTEQERFGHPLLAFEDPDGMAVELVGMARPPAVAHWEGGPVAPEMALCGFHSTTLQVRDGDASAALLRDLFGWREEAREGNRRRFVADGLVAEGGRGLAVDLVETPDLPRGRQGAGSIHHVAFRTPDDAAQEQGRAALAAAGLRVTPVRDRQYFHSIYFQEPNGVLYEIATDGPGFLWDESVETLGSSLRLPPWLEPQRRRIEELLPPIKVADGIL
jgi:glyoxalase family protein